MRAHPSTVLLAGLAILAIAPPVAAADPPSRTIFLHYDYMVAADHSHAPDPRAIDLVVEAFRRKGITLHVDPLHSAIPERRVVTFGPPVEKCAGSDAVSIEELRSTYLDRLDGHDWHYAVFAHRVNTPDPAHSDACASDLCGKPNPDATGTAEMPGRNLVVALGGEMELGSAITFGFEAATFMHELGHNLGLTHGGSAGDACINYKPNYISVMNYSYQTLAWGIPVAAAPGSSEFMQCSADRDCGRGAFCNALSDVGFRYCARVDYSDRLLPSLNEVSFAPGVGGLDENLGVAGDPTDRDIVLYWAAGALLSGPRFGPIDWNGDGDPTGTHVTANVNGDGSYTLLTGFDDWAHVGAYLNTPAYRKAASAVRPPVATCSQ